jgi:hypothetical protein
LVHFDHRRDIVLKETPAIWTYKRKLSEEEAEQALSVATTWELSLEQLSGDDDEREDKKELLTLAAFFNKQCISEALFITEKHSLRRANLGGCWDHYSFLDAVAELRKLHLIQALNDKTGRLSFAIHPLIQDWIKSRLTQDDRLKYVIKSTFLFLNYLCALGQNKGQLRIEREKFLHLRSFRDNVRYFLARDMRSNESTMRAFEGIGEGPSQFEMYAKSSSILDWLIDFLEQQKRFPDLFLSVLSNE